MQPLSLSNKTIVIGKLMYKTPKGCRLDIVFI